MTAEQFLLDVANHQMTVKIDSDLYRHLVFRQPKDLNMWFEIVTWRNCLTIHGDMGTWTFSRVEDMFTFFRSDKLRINTSYWDEKCQSDSRFAGPSRKFDPATFKANVLDYLDNYELSEPDKTGIIELLERSVFCEENEVLCRQALDEFKYDKFQFSPDAWEIDGRAYTYHFLWCLHAIVWAIQQYDATKVTQ